MRFVIDFRDAACSHPGFHRIFLACKKVLCDYLICPLAGGSFLLMRSLNGSNTFLPAPTPPLKSPSCP